jgi:hypothetical protein
VLLTAVIRENIAMFGTASLSLAALDTGTEVAESEGDVGILVSCVI